MAQVGLLPEEVWLKIISYMDLRSKLRVGCTCTFLRRIVEDTSLWSQINLTNRPDNERDARFDDGMNAPPKWSFPGDERKVMQFAHSYFTEKLKILHLDVLNTDILKYIRDTCVSIESLMLYHDKMSLRNIDLAFLPSNLKMLDLCLKGCFPRREFHRLRQGDRVPCNFGVTSLNQLSCLTIRYTEFSPILFERLSKCTNLSDITLHHCTCLSKNGFTKLADGVPNLSSLWLRYSSCLHHGLGFRLGPIFEGNLEMLELLSVIPELFKKLRSLKIQFIIKKKVFRDWPYMHDKIFRALLTLCDLRSLWLENTDILHYSQFIRLLLTLTELRELEFINDDNITTTVLVCLSTNLPHLYRLVLKDCAEVTDAGIRALANHTTLKYLNIQGCSKVSYRAIRDTILTIPTMKILVVSKYTSDEFYLCMTTLKEKMPSLIVYDIMGSSKC